MEKTPQIIRVLLADDQILFAENLKLMIETVTTDICVCGIAYNGKEAVALTEELKPDLVLMDVRMPELDGVQAAKRLRETYPDLKIVMLTTFLDDCYVQDALGYGAVGYLLKNIKPADLIASLRAASAGSVFLSPDLICKIFKTDTAVQDEETRTLNQLFNKLGPREQEILKLIEKGYNNKKIAETLYLSEPTIRNYISSIYAKIGSRDRLEVMSLAKKISKNQDS